MGGDPPDTESDDDHQAYQVASLLRWEVVVLGLCVHVLAPS